MGRRSSIYTVGATGELRALDGITGRLIWRTNILTDTGAANADFGMTASPLAVDQTIVVFPGGGGGQSMVAYHAATGKRMWSALDDAAAYSSPMLVTLGGVRQILALTASRLVAITGGGQVLWEYPWTKPGGIINASQPVLLGNDRVFVSSGNGMGAAVIELSRSGGGVREGQHDFQVREVWRNTRMKNAFSSSVLQDESVRPR